METPEQEAAVAAEDAAATGGFDDDNEDTPVLTVPAPTQDEDDEDDEVKVPEGARDPAAVEKLIKAERKAAREANARARELEAKLREQQPVQQETAEDKQAREAAEARALRLEIGYDKGLPKTLALRLQGATREEMEADAASLLSEVGSHTAGPGLGGGYKQDPPAPKADPQVEHQQFIANLLAGKQQGQ